MDQIIPDRATADVSSAWQNRPGPGYSWNDSNTKHRSLDFVGHAP
ncbi:hypothetical protein ACFQ61_13795 [Streptomyces sp. NPDC056500]